MSERGADKNLVIDQELCIGCGLCTSIASDTFELGEGGVAVVKDLNGDPKKAIQEAINSCPVDAISWSD